jgi:hypothetical protein
MLWHVLRFDVKDSSDDARNELVTSLRSLEAVPQVREVHVGYDVRDPGIVGMVMRLDSVDDLPPYRVHPLHLETLTILKRLHLTTTAIDITV